MQIPDYKMIPAPTSGCQGCDFRYMREVKCSAIDCRPKNNVAVIAKITNKKNANLIQAAQAMGKLQIVHIG
jgi:hypothetical protein